MSQDQGPECQWSHKGVAGVRSVLAMVTEMISSSFTQPCREPRRQRLESHTLPSLSSLCAAQLEQSGGWGVGVRKAAA